MIKICLVFGKSEPRYAYKLYAYEWKTYNYLDYEPIKELDQYSVLSRYCPISNIRFTYDYALEYDCRGDDRKWLF